MNTEGSGCNSLGFGLDFSVLHALRFRAQELATQGVMLRTWGLSFRLGLYAGSDLECRASISGLIRTLGFGFRV